MTKETSRETKDEFSRRVGIAEAGFSCDYSNCLGFAFYASGYSDKEEFVALEEAYMDFDKMEKIMKPKAPTMGDIIAFRNKNIIGNLPRYDHAAVVSSYIRDENGNPLDLELIHRRQATLHRNDKPEKTTLKNLLLGYRPSRYEVEVFRTK